MNIWHGIAPERVTPEALYAVIEIGRGGKVKYELDKETEFLLMDRVLYTSTQYPANYGIIPRTYAADNAPLDVLVLCSEALESLSLAECFPVGVICMIDGDDMDEKIIVLPFGDPVDNGCSSIEGLPHHIASEISHFFSVYKTLGGKSSAVEEIQGAEAAKGIIARYIDAYREARNGLAGRS